jgi:hypothetical protein
MRPFSSQTRRPLSICSTLAMLFALSPTVFAQQPAGQGRAQGRGRPPFQSVPCGPPAKANGRVRRQLDGAVRKRPLSDNATFRRSTRLNPAAVPILSPQELAPEFLANAGVCQCFSRFHLKECGFFVLPDSFEDA